MKRGLPFIPLMRHPAITSFAKIAHKKLNFGDPCLPMRKALVFLKKASKRTLKTRDHRNL